MESENVSNSSVATPLNNSETTNKFIPVTKANDGCKTSTNSEGSKETTENSLEGQLDDMIILDDYESSRSAVNNVTNELEIKNECTKQSLSNANDDKSKCTNPNEVQTSDTKSTPLNEANLAADVTKCLPGNNIPAQLNSSENSDLPKEKSLNQTKAPEADSFLILTADDEFETEPAISDKKKKNNLAASVQKSGKEICKTLVENHAVKVEKINKNEETVISANSEAGTSVKLEESKKAFATKTVWITNISQSVKATNLKQFVSQKGKVVTAKIVTDGKHCYGYVVMGSSDAARDCAKSLNNETFEGHKINVSLTKPSIDRQEVIKQEKSEPSKRKSRTPSVTSSRPAKRRSLTTKFDTKAREHKRRSSSIEKRTTLSTHEREHIKRRIIDEQTRHREEIYRDLQREEKQRQMEFKLEQEHRKLQLERRLFERERRELTRLDIERRKIERERIEVLRQRAKLAEELQKLSKTKSTAVSYGRKEEKKERKVEPSRAKVDFGRDARAKVAPPPPPKLNSELDVSLGRKMNKHSDRKYDSGERKCERGGHKIEDIDRKYYVQRYEDDSERKHDRTYRKADTEDRKVNNPFTDRKFDCNRDVKRFRDEHYFERDNQSSRNNQWQPNVYTNNISNSSNNEMWKTPSNAVSSNGNSSTSTRYPENNFSTAYNNNNNGPVRIPRVIYHPIQTGIQEYRYDHYQQVRGRKY